MFIKDELQELIECDCMHDIDYRWYMIASRARAHCTALCCFHLFSRTNNIVTMSILLTNKSYTLSFATLFTKLVFFEQFSSFRRSVLQCFWRSSNVATVHENTKTKQNVDHAMSMNYYNGDVFTVDGSSRSNRSDRGTCQTSRRPILDASLSNRHRNRRWKSIIESPGQT